MFLLRYALASALLVPLHTLAQQPATAPPGGLVIRLEQLRNDKVIPVRPEHVFGTDDVLRFRLKSATDGFVYVVDHATSGDYTVLFPANDLAGNNAVRGETEFYVPSPEEGWFQVGGAAGFDTIYFLLSPIKLAVSSTQTRSKQQEKLPDNLLPRCNDTIFQARGECVDSTAGPAVLPRGASLPPQISTAAANASRDLVMVNEADGNVKVTKTSDGPAVYIFRIAHK
ncbi:MAG: DUF4384 domain-containing protein [Janthinobacterium lividum]